MTLHATLWYIRTGLIHETLPARLYGTAVTAFSSGHWAYDGNT